MFMKQLTRKTSLCRSFNLFRQALSSKSQSNKVSLYLRRARLIDSIRLALRSNTPGPLATILNDPALDSFVVTNALKSAPSPDSALSLIECLKKSPTFAHTQPTLYALAKILAKSQQTDKLKSLVRAINSGYFHNVARISFMDQLRWYAAAGDVDLVIRVWDEWRALQKYPTIESYNIVMGVYAQMGMNSEAVKFLFSMIEEGVVPNSRTFTVMIEHLLNNGKLDSSVQIFNLLPVMRINRTLKQYSLLVGTFSAIEQFDVARSLLNEMRVEGLLPGRKMHCSLHRMQVAGFLEETSEFIQEMLPDNRIKNVRVPVVGGTCAPDDDEVDDNDDDDNEDVNELQLRPWLDPAALARALDSWGPEEVSALQDAKFVWTTRLVCKMIRSFKLPETAWKFFWWVTDQQGFTHDVHTISGMLSKVARQGRVGLVEELLRKVRKEGLKLPYTTVQLVIDFYGIFGVGHAALKVFNDVKTLCGAQSNTAQLALYSSIFRALTKCKMNSEVLYMLDEMILGGITPDNQTFSQLMRHFELEGDIDTVQRLFSMVKPSGLKPDIYMFKLLIRAYCKCGRSVLALRVLEEMMDCDLVPDDAMKQLLVRSLWKEGKLREAASVEERSGKVNDPLSLAPWSRPSPMNSEYLTKVCNIYSDSFVTKEA